MIEMTSSSNEDDDRRNSDDSESSASSSSDSEQSYDEKPLSICNQSETTRDEDDSRLSVKQETESDEDVPLSAKKSIKREPDEDNGNNINGREDSDEEKPLTKVKQESTKRTSSKRPNYAEESDEEDIPLSKKKATKKPKTRYSSDEDGDHVNGKKTSPKKRKKASSESDYGSDSEIEKEKKKKKKKESKVKKEPASSSKKKATTKTKVKEEEKSPRKAKKKEEDEQHVWKWWLEENNDPNEKWKTLCHKGPVFAPPYEPLPSHVKFYYDGKHFKLNVKAEEVATFYGRMLDHDYTSKEVFNKNFFKDWKKFMTKEEKELITDLKKCDFREMNEYFKEQSEKRKQMTKEEKLARKAKEEEIQKEYGYCVVDGHKQKIGNYKIEPPGLFRGRGEHPKMGKVKRRIEAEDVIINIGKKAEVPAPPPGHKWKEVRHDKTVTWLASWTENIMGSVKYIMLNPSSKLKSMKDWQKYEKARELAKFVDKIRSDYREDFKAREMMKRQRAVALYFIDKLALRAGNEKEEGETADTVGCCSLRVEHITLHEEKDGQSYVVEFDFLGKDSIRYQNSVSVEKRVFKSLRVFMENKSPSDDLFDRLTTASMNKYLNTLMEGLTAKVFRTYNASITLQDQLKKLTRADMTMPEKVLAYNRANRAVAVLCNHQRAVPKTFEKQMENINSKISDKRKQISDVKKDMKHAKKSNETKEYEKYKKKLGTLEEQLKKLEVQAVDKDENKQIALGTSKLNYLDPRITVAWCKKYDVPIEKVYNKTHRDKFRWAIEMVGADYEF